MAEAGLKYIAFNCSLKSAADAESSSTDVLLEQFLDALAKHGADGQVIRAVDHDIKPGVTSDEGVGDAWPALRAMGSTVYKDLPKPLDAVAKWTPMLASNVAHLARLLKWEAYPGIEGGR